MSTIVFPTLKIISAERVNSLGLPWREEILPEECKNILEHFSVYFDNDMTYRYGIKCFRHSLRWKHYTYDKLLASAYIGDPVGFAYYFLKNRHNFLPALDVAFSRSKINSILELITNGNVNAVDKEGRTALLWAISHERIDLVEQLIAANANVSAVDNFGCNALKYAAQIGKLDIVNLLLNFDTNLVSIQNALICAVEHENVEVVRELCQVKGINVNMLNNSGWPAIAYAFSNIEKVPDFEDIPASEEALEIIDILCDTPGFDVNVIIKKKLCFFYSMNGLHEERVVCSSLLMLAVECRDINIVNRILNINGIDVNLIVDGKTALMLANKELGDLEIADRLRQAGAV